MAALMACLWASAGVLNAETVITNRGKSYTGKVTVTPHVLRCVSPGIKRTLALPVIKDIELSGGERLKFELQKRKLPPFDAEAHHSLGMWLKSKHQHGMAQDFFRKAILIDDAHAGARRELGFVRKQEVWVYSPALHQRLMYRWVGRKSVAFHLKLAQQLHQLKLTKQTEQELRRVLQIDQINATAIRMLRPIIADYRCRNRYKLPFRGTWRAVSGSGRGSHGGYSDMMNAWDFRKVDEHSRFWSGPPNELKNHLTFEQPVYACADGEVYEVRGKFPDNPIGVIRPIKEGNRVSIKHAKGERSVIGHLQKGSIRVKVGDRVKQGQLLGLIGNSGRSATPHIHFAIYDADGISLPVTFVDLHVVEPTGRKHVESGRIESRKIYDNGLDEPARKRR